MRTSRFAYPATCATALAALVLTYSNHFHNSFHFDDVHTLQNNLFLRDLRNLPRFFRDAATFSSLPSNQSYRPLVTTTYAVDYWLAGGLSPFAFHLDSFFFFALQCLLVGALAYRIFEAARPSRANRWLGVAAASAYGLHPAAAETVNYFSARSEILSTLGVVAALWLYLASARARRFHLYLLPAVLGTLAKESGAMFAPLLFLLVVCFEGELRLGRDGWRPDMGKALRRAGPALVVCGATLGFSVRMAPGFVPGGTSRLGYLLTQPFVMLHYVTTFFWPTQLSADTDWKPVTGWGDARVWMGGAFVLSMVLLALRAFSSRRTRPITFGILWFFVALIPTSTVIPLAEVANDHRLYFPFVGLVLAVTWGAELLRQASEARLGVPRWAWVGLAVGVVSGQALGAHARNEVWHDEASLWWDVTRKSPANPRGLMNYGVALLERGDVRGALPYFERAVALAPSYGYAHTNLGLALAATGQPAAAELEFRTGIQEQPRVPMLRTLYARWLDASGRSDEALAQLYAVLKWAPGDAYGRALWEAIQARTHPSDAPLTAEAYVEQSLQAFRRKDYLAVLVACERALALRPRYPEALNNQCSALNRLGRFAEAKRACQAALEEQPSWGIVRNNLAEAERGLASAPASP